MKYKIYQVDSFSNSIFAGNPACVVPLSKWLSDSMLLNIAKENAVAETAFFIDHGDYIHLRWFTPDLEIDLCDNEEEAKSKAALLTQQSKKFPVYFFKSDTSGEKTFEEFYTINEILDLEKFKNLGVIKNSIKRDLTEIDSIFDNLKNIFLSDKVSKSVIVDALIKYLPNFEHIETGKHLDQKM